MCYFDSYTTMEITSQAGKSNEFGFVRDGKVYANAFLHLPQRQIGEVKETEEAALAYFVNRFDIIKNKVTSLLQNIETAQNKGSYLMKLIHLRQQMEHFDALGDFPALFEQLDRAEESLQELIVQNRQKNLEIKQALIVETEELGNDGDWRGVSDKIKEIKSKWLKTGAVAKEQEEELEQHFTDVLNTFFEKRKVYFEERNRSMEERIKKYEDLIAQLEPHARMDAHMGKAIRAVKGLQEEWKNVGAIPKEHFEPLWNKFSRFKKDIFRNMKQAKRAREEAEGILGGGSYRLERSSSSYGERQPFRAPSPYPAPSGGGTGGYQQRTAPPRTAPPRPPLLPEYQEVFDKKMEIIKEAEQLTEMELRAAVEKAKALQFQWRDSGLLPPPFKNETNERFLTATDRIHEINNVQKLAFERSHFIKSKPLKEQLVIKIAVIQDLIKKDEAEFNLNQKAFDVLTIEEKALPPNKALYAKISNLRRRLRIKYEMLSSMEKQIAEL